MDVAKVSAPLSRDAECAALERVLEEARGGHRSELVLRGEPGVGKSVLLDYTVGRASAFAMARAAGAESELELPLAGLQQLLSTTTTPTSTTTSTSGWSNTRGSRCTSPRPRAPG